MAVGLAAAAAPPRALEADGAIPGAPLMLADGAAAADGRVGEGERTAWPRAHLLMTTAAWRCISRSILSGTVSARTGPGGGAELGTASDGADAAAGMATPPSCR